MSKMEEEDEIDTGNECSYQISKNFAELNERFIFDCIQNIKENGREVCLLPLAFDYLTYSLDLLKQNSSHGKEEMNADIIKYLESFGNKLANILEKHYEIIRGENDTNRLKIDKSKVVDFDRTKQQLIPSEPTSSASILPSFSREECSFTLISPNKTSSLPPQNISTLISNSPERNSPQTSPSSSFKLVSPGNIKGNTTPTLSPSVSTTTTPFSFGRKSDDCETKKGDNKDESFFGGGGLRGFNMISPGNISGSSNLSSSKPGSPFTFGFGKETPMFNGVGTGGSTSTGASTNFLSNASLLESTGNGPNEEEEEEHVKNEKAAQEHVFVPVVVTSESNILYSTKCRIYEQKNGAYVKRGLGMLYIEKDEKNESKKEILLIRADNSVGSPLLHFIITSDIPFTLMKDKKQIITIDPISSTPVSLQVGSIETAQTLYDHLKRIQNKNK